VRALAVIVKPSHPSILSPYNYITMPCEICKGTGWIRIGVPCVCNVQQPIAGCTKCFVITDDKGQHRKCSGACNEPSYSTNNSEPVVATRIRVWPISFGLN
jgi:hypothetical protein